jgi:hypothetical protein
MVTFSIYRYICITLMSLVTIAVMSFFGWTVMWPYMGVPPPPSPTQTPRQQINDHMDY